MRWRHERAHCHGNHNRAGLRNHIHAGSPSSSQRERGAPSRHRNHNSAVAADQKDNPANQDLQRFRGNSNGRQKARNPFIDEFDPVPVDRTTLGWTYTEERAANMRLDLPPNQRCTPQELSDENPDWDVV